MQPVSLREAEPTPGLAPASTFSSSSYGMGSSGHGPNPFRVDLRTPAWNAGSEMFSFVSGSLQQQELLALATMRKTSLKTKPTQRSTEPGELQRKTAGAFTSGLFCHRHLFLFYCSQIRSTACGMYLLVTLTSTERQSFSR